ncbi:hypothetical protein Bca101_058651 [Brassica carinata]
MHLPLLQVGVSTPIKRWLPLRRKRSKGSIFHGSQTPFKKISASEYHKASRIASTESLGMNSNQLSGMNSRRVATTGPRTYLSQYCNMGLDYFGDVSFMEEKPQIYTNQFELTNSFSVGDNNIYQYLSSDKGSNSFDCP